MDFQDEARYGESRTTLFRYYTPQVISHALADGM